MRNLVYIAIAVRVMTNLQQFSSKLYFVGRDMFELVALVVILNYTKEKKTRDLIEFCIGLCLWNLVKPMFCNPSITDWWEVIGFFLGLGYLNLKYVRKRNIR